MPEQLDSFDFGRSNAKYDWEPLFDGNIYRLVQGEDFEAKPSSVIASARKAANKANKKLEIRTDGDNVVLRAT